MAAWYKKQQPELRLSERAAGAVVQQTENFSFAYMKELFVSATMQWMSNRGDMLDSPSGDQPNDGSMDATILDQAARLRAQMITLSESPALSASTNGPVARALATARRFFTLKA